MYVESVMNMLKGKMRIIKKIVKNNKLLSDISIKIQCSLTFCFIDCHWKYFLPNFFLKPAIKHKSKYICTLFHMISC